MSRIEQLALALLGGLLILVALVFLWPPFTKSLEVLVTIGFSVVLLVSYVRWLHTRWVSRGWLAPAILLSWLLLTAFIDARVFQRAEVVSYSKEEGWISEQLYYSPNYANESLPLLLVFFGPLGSLSILLAITQRGQRARQFGHYLLLLITVYPLAAAFILSGVEKQKPRYYEGAILPPIGNIPGRVVDRKLLDSQFIYPAQTKGAIN